MLILLDRDGVINQDLPQSVTSVSDFRLLSGVGKAIARLNQAGHKIAIATNQACVGRGDLSTEVLDDIHHKMRLQLAADGAYIDKIYSCTDTEIAPNNRRKPAPGMLLEALADFGENPENAVMIGDALRDLEAAEQACCSSILVLTGKGLLTKALLKEQKSPLHPLSIVTDLTDAVDFLLSSSFSLPLPASQLPASQPKAQHE